MQNWFRMNLSECWTRFSTVYFNAILRLWCHILMIDRKMRLIVYHIHQLSSNHRRLLPILFIYIPSNSTTRKSHKLSERNCSQKLYPMRSSCTQLIINEHENVKSCENEQMLYSDLENSIEVMFIQFLLLWCINKVIVHISDHHAYSSICSNNLRRMIVFFSSFSLFPPK